MKIFLEEQKKQEQMLHTFSEKLDRILSLLEKEHDGARATLDRSCAVKVDNPLATVDAKLGMLKVERLDTPKTERADTPKTERADMPKTERADMPKTERLDTATVEELDPLAPKDTDMLTTSTTSLSGSLKKETLELEKLVTFKQSKLEPSATIDSFRSSPLTGVEITVSEKAEIVGDSKFAPLSMVSTKGMESVHKECIDMQGLETQATDKESAKSSEEGFLRLEQKDVSNETNGRLKKLQNEQGAKPRLDLAATNKKSATQEKTNNTLDIHLA